MSLFVVDWDNMFAFLFTCGDWGGMCFFLVLVCLCTLGWYVFCLPVYTGVVCFFVVFVCVHWGGMFGISCFCLPVYTWVVCCFLFVCLCRLGGGVFGDTHLAKWSDRTVVVKRFTLVIHPDQITPDALKLMRNEVWFLR